MIVKIGCAELNIGIPAVAHELRTDDFLSGVAVTQRLAKEEKIPSDLFDLFDLEALILIHAHADDCPGMEALGAAHFDARCAGWGVGFERLPFYFERADRLFIVKAGADAIASLNIKLSEVNMDVRFTEEAILAGVLELALEDDVHAIFAGVGTEG